MIFYQIPNNKTIQSIIKKQSRLPFTYFEVNETKDSKMIKGFDNDYLRVKIGTGIEDFLFAKSLIADWRMFPTSWTVVFPVGEPIKKDQTIVLLAKFAGIWWMNCSRIVYLISESRKFGFAYGTLPGHMERGEELFQVSIDKNEEVWYEIKAFSRPRFWLTKLLYPVMRRLQERFRQDSARQLQELVMGSVRTDKRVLAIETQIA